MKRIAALLVSALIVSALFGCSGDDDYSFNSIITYKDIPNITSEEISDIEKLIMQDRVLSYGHLHETEAFRRPDGTYAGFSIKMCGLLSDLFGIRFEPVYYDGWETLKNELDNMELDFSGMLTPTPERLEYYLMTEPIAGRTLKLYTYAGTREITDETDLNGAKVGFLAGTVTSELILEHYPELDYEIVYLSGFDVVTDMLRDGDIDAFVVDETADIEFMYNEHLSSQDFFDMVYTPVSVTTANPEYRSIITVIDKYLEAGGFNAVHDLYEQGKTEYTSQKLQNTFTEEEKAYIANLVENDIKVDIGLQHDVYPVSFYNTVDGEFQGIALDILNRVSSLTGIYFEPKSTTTDTPLSEILSKLRNGEISMMTQLLYTDSRKNDYLWSKYPYHVSNYALLSSTGLPDLDPFQVYYVRVGTVNRSAHEEIFNIWFPGHENRVVYSTTEDAFDALANGDIDLLMLSESMLLTMSNYREEPGFKVNLSFNKKLNSLFGYHREEELLRSIVDKTLLFIDMEKLSDDWVNRSFDYSRKITQMQTIYMRVFTTAVFIAMIAMLFLLIKNKRLSKNFLERSSKLSAIFTAIPDIIFCMDTNLIYTSCNPGFERFSGRPEREVIGKNDLEIFGADRDKEMIDCFMRINKCVIETKETAIIQEWVTSLDGEKRFLESIKTPLFQDGKMTGIMGIARDITEHKAAEDDAREASKAKSMFLANMSHEIRTPMNAIIGMTELLLNEQLSERQLNYVTDINVSAHALLAIINDILDLSKIEAGKLEINPVDYDFHVLVDNITSMFMFVSEKKGLEFKFESSGELPKYIYGDDIRLRQVLTNICGNAVKFTASGYIKLSIDAEDDRIVFKIRDTGIGIKKEDIPKLFSAFSQADKHKNRNIVGTGLGLAISKDFVEMMGGKISVDSVYGQGTVFTVSLPKIIGNEKNIKYDDGKSKSNAFNAPDAKILVVDDNEVNLKVASGLLNLYGITATTVLSGKEAIEQVQSVSYDIVFMDHMMPEMDGIETTGAIRKLGGKYAQMTIIALTANAIHGAKEMFLLNGFDGFISKPIEVTELADMLREFLPERLIHERNEAAPGQSGVSGSAFMRSLRSVVEINTEIGLNRVSGMEDMYHDTLEIFYRKLPSECDKLESFISGGDLAGFSITSHGIKSTLATIGAMSLSQAAFDLETASKGGDAAYCQEKLPVFLESLRLLREHLSEVFVEKTETVDRPAGDTALLSEKTAAALAAAEDFDEKTAIESLDELMEYDFGGQVNQLLSNAKDALRDFDYDAAADNLKKIES